MAKTKYCMFFKETEIVITLLQNVSNSGVGGGDGGGGVGGCCSGGCGGCGGARFLGTSRTDSNC